MRWAALFFVLLAASPAAAQLSERDLATIASVASPGARVPLDLVFEDGSGRRVSLAQAFGGRPGLLLPVDFTCRTTCRPALAIASSALARTGLSPGKDYSFVAVGIDAKDGHAAARAFADGQTADATLAATARILVGGSSSTTALLDALGYRAVYDAGADQFAHPAAAFALTPDGRVARVLSTLALEPRDLRLALAEAGEGRIGGFATRIALLCYGYDAARGVYTPAIQRILTAAALLTVLLLGLSLLLLRRRSLSEARTP